MPNSINISTEADPVETGPSVWQLAPDSILLGLFFYLDKATDLEKAGQVCQTWFRVSRDEFLWRKHFYRDYKIKGRATSVSPLGGGEEPRSWRLEYIRLNYLSPTQESEILRDHSNQVLHVCFAHDGRHFSTCSKDGFVKVWNAGYPASVRYARDMREFVWKYTQFSQFNETDELLLVSGVHQGAHSTSGEIAVFNVEEGFQLQCRVQNKPYDIFGTWYSENHLLSGDLRWLGHLVSSSILWINKASQDTDSEHKPVVKPLFRFYNKNASSIRTIMVANCHGPPVPSEQGTCEGHIVGDRRPSPPDEAVFCPLCHCANNQHQCTVDRCPDFKEHHHLCNHPLADNSSSSDSRVVDPCESGTEITPSSSSNDDSAVDGVEDVDESDDDSDDGNQILDDRDKYLIFTTGSQTFTPHQIGFKRIRPFKFGEQIPMDLRDKLREREERNNNPPPQINWPNEESVHHLFDKADHYIDLHGHIIGMALSPDHRYLYVNSRSWPVGYEIESPLLPPPLAREIDIHVIDMLTLKEVGTVLRSHQAYTPNDECFFIFLDVSGEYVASGAEDKHGYIWDRNYGICLAKFPHEDVVNSVAFNPTNSEMIVTASDDFTVKVWRSKRQQRIIGQLHSSAKDEETKTVVYST